MESASAGSPKTLAPNDSNRDCSQGLCSVNCPQWCNYFFPPPPDDDVSSTTFSPLIIAVIGILGSAFLLVSYYTFITKYCKRRSHGNQEDIEGAHHDEMAHDQWQQGQIGSNGLEEGLIKSITVFKYNKEEKLVEGTECSVCLNEFQENENLRLLPKCCHAFHPPCIDTWLKSHTNCPLCRANAAPTFPLPPSIPPSQTSSTVDISALAIQRQNDSVLVIQERERTHHGELINFASSVSRGHVPPKSPNADQDELRLIRRSISLGTLSSQRNLLVADILRIDEDEKDSTLGISQLEMGIGSSRGIMEEEQSKENHIVKQESLAEVKRSFSTGRFNLTGQDKGKNYTIPS